VTSIATVTDNFMGSDEFNELKQACWNYAHRTNRDETDESGETVVKEDWVGKNQNPVNTNNYILRNIAAKIKQELINKKLINSDTGYEYWLNINKQQDYHFDCDEGLRQKHGILRFPIVSTVFYISCPEQSYSKKGDLMLHKEQVNIKSIHNVYSKKAPLELSSEFQLVSAKENRLVYFPPKIPHKVTKWEEGERSSLAINFWNHRPLEKNYTDDQLLRTLLRTYMSQ